MLPKIKLSQVTIDDFKFFSFGKRFYLSNAKKILIKIPLRKRRIIPAHFSFPLLVREWEMLKP